MTADMKNFEPGEDHTEWHEPLHLVFWRDGKAATRSHADRVDIMLVNHYVGTYAMTDRAKWSQVVHQFRTAFDLGKAARSREIYSMLKAGDQR